MKIGFPIVEKHACSLFICEIKKALTPTITAMQGDIRGQVKTTAFPGTYQRFVTGLIDSGYSVVIKIEKSSLNAEPILVQRLNNHVSFDFDGRSGTLALFILHELRAQIADSSSTEIILLSGNALTPGDKLKITSLKSDLSELSKKITGSNAHDLWIIKEDYDQIVNGDIGKTIPFLAPNDQPDWLIHEMCEKYDLSVPLKYTQKPDEIPAGSLTERDLFIAAIDDLDSEPDLRARFETYFLKNPARQLLPVQEAALIKKNQGVFSKSGRRIPRHVIVSGPTGCGKTSLMHAILLNALHNRSEGALYVGPVKALVEEFHHHVEKDLELLRPANSERRIVISTGDYWRDDPYISRGEFGLACMVYEKASILFTSDQEQEFLKRISLLIVDELHMMQDPTRGDVVDVLIMKCFKENQWRNDRNIPPIQLVLISTEGVTDSIEKLRHFTVENESGNRMPPVIIKSDFRNPPVRHQICIASANKQPHSKVLDICDFSNNSMRRLSEFPLKDLRRTLYSPKILYAEATHKKTVVNICIDLIHKLLTVDFHHTIIVACNSTNLCHWYAGLLSSRLSHILNSRTTVDETFIADLNESGLSPSLINDIGLWRRSGVFVHHGQLPAKLRTSTSQIFREKIFANTRPKVLFTTETLTYGVNLSASCVVLTALEFTREDPVNPKVKPNEAPLQATQYHDLLGRAGRKGYEKNPLLGVAHPASSITANAIVVLGEGLFSDRGKLLDNFLTPYYGEQRRSVLISTIAHKMDYSKFENGTNVEESDLNTLSFSIFRTILECVRTTGNNATFQSIEKTFQLTIGYQTASPVIRLQLDRLFKFTLDKCVTYEAGLIKLLDYENGLYTIKNTASALIDTGSSLHSLEPIAVWSKAIVDSADYPPEAILPGILVAPEFTKVVCELFGDYVFEVSTDADRIQEDRQANALASAIINLTPIFAAQTQEFVKKVTQFFESPSVAEAMRMVPDRVNRKVVAYRLLAAISLWIRGASVELILAEFTDFEKPPKKRWVPKHSDRLEQLIKMAYRYFSVGNGFLSDKLKLELPKLAIRIKHGIPFMASPYIQLVGSDGVFPRSTVNYLFSNIPDSFSLLNESKSEQNTRELTACLANLPDGNKTTADVISVVRNSYSDSLNYFVSRLISNEVRELCQSALTAMKPEHDGAIFSSFWLSDRLLDLLVEKSGTQVGYLKDNDVGHAGTIKFRCLHTAEHRPAGCVYLLNWHEPAPVGLWTITPCAFMLINVLFKRRFLTLTTFSEKLNSSPAERINVFWVASQLEFDGSIRGATTLRESMLSFLEPQSPI